MKNLWRSDRDTGSRPEKEGDIPRMYSSEMHRLAPYMNTEADGSPVNNYKKC